MREFSLDSKVDVNYWCKENMEQNLDAPKFGKKPNGNLSNTEDLQNLHNQYGKWGIMNTRKE